MYISILLAVTFVINGILFICPIDVNAIKPTIYTISMTKNETNNIILNATEIEEKYKWADINGLENPTINLTSNTE